MRRLATCLALMLSLAACATPQAQRATGGALMVAGLGGVGVTVGLGVSTEDRAPMIGAMVVSAAIFSLGTLLLATGWADVERAEEIEDRGAFDE